MSKQIPLTRSEFAIVDDDDYEWLCQRKWCLHVNHTKKYARSNFRRAKGVWSPDYMHRYIMGFPGMEVDHINGNGLDNRRVNLRLVTREQNAHNTRTPITNTSGFKGVHRVGRRWKAQIRFHDKIRYLGYFDTPEQAKQAYDKAAKEHRGDFARLD